MNKKEKIHHAYSKYKKTEMATSLSDKINFRTKEMSRTKKNF
jgi:hypothetical protein